MGSTRRRWLVVLAVVGVLATACRPGPVRDLQGTSGIPEFSYITWTESIDYAGYVVGYEVYRDGVLVDFVPTPSSDHDEIRYETSTEGVYEIIAVDDEGKRSDPVATYVGLPAGFEATMTGTLDGNDVHLEWQDAVDEFGFWTPCAQLTLRRNGAPLTTVNLADVTYVDENVLPGEYTYDLWCVDAFVTGPTVTIGVPDTDAPDPPSGVAGSGVDTSGDGKDDVLRVTWDPAGPNQGIFEYEIWTSFRRMHVLSNRTSVDIPARAGEHPVRVTARDWWGNEATSATIVAEVGKREAYPPNPTETVYFSYRNDSSYVEWFPAGDDTRVEGWLVDVNDVSLGYVPNDPPELGFPANNYGNLPEIDAWTGGAADYRMDITARDVWGNLSPARRVYVDNDEFVVVDVPWVRGLQLTELPSGAAQLDWDPLPGYYLAAAHRFAVLRNGIEIAQVVDTTTYTDLTPAPGLNYYEIQTIDDAGNRSEPWDQVALAVPLGGLLPPSSAGAALDGDQVRIGFSPPADWTPVGYRILRDGVAVTDVGSSPVFLTGEPPGLHRYEVVALAADGSASGPTPPRNAFELLVEDPPKPTATMGYSYVNDTLTVRAWSHHPDIAELEFRVDGGAPQRLPATASEHVSLQVVDPSAGLHTAEVRAVLTDGSISEPAEPRDYAWKAVPFTP